MEVEEEEGIALLPKKLQEKSWSFFFRYGLNHT